MIQSNILWEWRGEKNGQRYLTRMSPGEFAINLLGLEFVGLHKGKIFYSESVLRERRTRRYNESMNLDGERQ